MAAPPPSIVAVIDVVVAAAGATFDGSVVAAVDFDVVGTARVTVDGRTREVPAASSTSAEAGSGADDNVDVEDEIAPPPPSPSPSSIESALISPSLTAPFIATSIPSPIIL